RAERLRITERGLDREMVLERDFALHEYPSAGRMMHRRAGCGQARTKTKAVAPARAGAIRRDSGCGGPRRDSGYRAPLAPGRRRSECRAQDFSRSVSRESDMPPAPTSPALTIRAIRTGGVEVPMTYALGTSRGTITKASLLLIDLETEEGVTGRSYLW